VFVDIVAGVMVSLVLACFLLFKRFSDMTQSEISHASTGHHHKTRHLKLPDDIMVYHINGSIFFGTVERVFDHIIGFDDHIKTMIIEMEDVTLIDMTGLVAMKAMIFDAQNKNMAVILCGSTNITDKILQELPLSSRHKLKVAKTIDKAAAIITSAKHEMQVAETIDGWQKFFA
jgi:SulP family sulfate permease